MKLIKNIQLEENLENRKAGKKNITAFYFRVQMVLKVCIRLSYRYIQFI